MSMLQGSYLIAGATGAIGRSLARTVWLRGGTPVLCGRDASKLQALREELAGIPRSVGADASLLPPSIVVDFAQSDQVAGLLSPDKLPGDLCGFAYAVGSVTLKPMRSVQPQHFMESFQLNTVSLFETTKAILPALKKQKVVENASIVYFSTVAVQSGFPNHAVVSASKGAVEGLTRALAAELATSRIRVNCIAPSLTEESAITAPLTSNEKMATAIAAAHPISRLGRPYDSAAAAAFLLSEDSTWVTGQILGVDGGRSALVLK